MQHEEGNFEPPGPRDQRVQPIQRQHARRIRRGGSGIGVHLEKQSIGAGRDGRQAQRFDELGLTAASLPLATRKLDRMCRIEDGRATRRRAHDAEASHIHDPATVPECEPSLGHRDIRSARDPHLLHRVGDLLRRHPLPFLDVDGQSARAGRLQKIRLATEEGRHL